MIPIRTSIALLEIPGVVIALIITNVLIFLYQVSLPADGAVIFIQTYALTPSNFAGIINPNAEGPAARDLLTLISNTFLHGGWLHLIANMWTLWLFGSVLEERLGAGRFIVLYLACGLIADFAHMASDLLSNIPALGASGAIAGIVGAFTLLYPKARIMLLTMILFFPITYSMSAFIYTGIWFAFQIFGGLVDLASPGQGGVAWWAHIGGLIAGLGLISVLGSAKSVRQIGETPINSLGLSEMKLGATRLIGEQRPRRFKFGTGVSRQGKDSPTWDEPAQKSPRQKRETNADTGAPTLRSFAKVQGTAILDNMKLSLKGIRAQPEPTNWGNSPHRSFEDREAPDPRLTPGDKPRTRRKKSIIPQTVKSPWSEDP
jgi:membrane associated rhomboid family serine protease